MVDKRGIATFWQYIILSAKVKHNLHNFAAGYVYNAFAFSSQKFAFAFHWKKKKKERRKIYWQGKKNSPSVKMG